MKHNITLHVMPPYMSRLLLLLNLASFEPLTDRLMTEVNTITCTPIQSLIFYRLVAQRP
jgi:hypothetical protein